MTSSLKQFVWFIHWDRTGAIVSRHFDYTKDSGLLFDFYKRFSQLSPSQRGKDAWVPPVTDDNDNAIAARVKFGPYVTDMWHGDARAKQKRKIKIEKQKLLRMEVTLQGVVRRFVVCAQNFDEDSLSPFGQSTCRSLALDLDSPDLHDPKNPRGGLLFMKVYWRADSSGTAKESDIYHLLAQHRVPHVAEMETGGDVPDMVTPSELGRTNSLPSWPQVGNVNKYGGEWDMRPSNVMFNGEFDPWRTMGLASIEDNSPIRLPSIVHCNCICVSVIPPESFIDPRQFRSWGHQDFRESHRVGRSDATNNLKYLPLSVVNYWLQFLCRKFSGFHKFSIVFETKKNDAPVCSVSFSAVAFRDNSHKHGALIPRHCATTRTDHPTRIKGCHSPAIPQTLLSFFPHATRYLPNECLAKRFSRYHSRQLRLSLTIPQTRLSFLPSSSFHLPPSSTRVDLLYIETQSTAPHFDTNHPHIRLCSSASLTDALTPTRTTRVEFLMSRIQCYHQTAWLSTIIVLR
ncbi:uncharacterized protein BT62DRAFT_1008559 [Guyanagaster necrorhizus]|uniref:Uncharacterized protein n=1 Tax=Guyanagaster necrorhizus TaxID=856835 RepID=A0A9P8AQ06_9AGAR|nr:uncharacterized protein BT62DRAFT_1008559 [Guyanagaster necrorhizus MCA 3950]KAG7443883.1 hypothetical protein BT62DRAFT_1008559 [Guyanagaster necrorhizus MCA 3950]